jgi:hypothetical protein
MPVSHAPVPARALITVGRERAPGLLEALAQVAGAPVVTHWLRQRWPPARRRWRTPP